MKQKSAKLWLLMIWLTSTLPLMLFAQDDGGSSTTQSTTKTEITMTESTGTEWYTSPWVWIAGAAVFILLLVALLSNRGSDRSTDRVIIKKTVDKD